MLFPMYCNKVDVLCVGRSMNSFLMIECTLYVVFCSTASWAVMCAKKSQTMFYYLFWNVLYGYVLYPWLQWVFSASSCMYRMRYKGIKGLCFRHSSLVGYSCQRLFIKKNIPTMITSNIGKFVKILLRCRLNICLGDHNVCQLYLTSIILNPSMYNFGNFKLEFHSY